MVWIVDIMCKGVPLVKIELEVYKVSRNYIISTHILVNRKYQNVISMIRTVHFSTSIKQSLFKKENLKNEIWGVE